MYDRQGWWGEPTGSRDDLTPAEAAALVAIIAAMDDATRRHNGSTAFNEKDEAWLNQLGITATTPEPPPNTTASSDCWTKEPPATSESAPGA